ncbi:MAG: hypothetical protein HQL56_17250 [Magnetococcales bacterium]|nr:hypothetical protein [Magnetococcales bacterium]
MSNLRERFLLGMEKVDALTRRERVILLGLSLVVLGGGWDSLVRGPMEVEMAAVEKSVHEVDGRIAEIKKNQNMILSRKDEDPDQENTAKKAQLQKEIADLGKLLEKNTRNLVPPGDMVKMLRAFLQEVPELTLVRMETRAPISLLEKKKKDNKDKGKDKAPKRLGLFAETPAPASGAADKAKALQQGAAALKQLTGTDKEPAAAAKPENKAPEEEINPEDLERVYKHEVILEMSGTYMALLQYLQTLESAPSVVFWQDLEFLVGEYPKGTVKLTLYTLSLTEAWLGS